MNESVLDLDTSTEAVCKNCETEMSGHFCSSCGQPDKHLDPSLHDLVHELTHEFLHLDDKIVSTMKALILRPGQLTAAFLAGRRARYIGPVRLYLTMSLVFFLVLGVAGHKSGGAHVSTMQNTTEASTHDSKAPAEVAGSEPVEAKPDDVVAAEIKKAAPGQLWILKIAEKAVKDPEQLRHAIVANISRVMFVIVPLFAVGLRLAYRNRKRRYPSFVYFALHYHSFLFLALTVSLLVGFLHIKWLERMVGFSAMAYVLVYLFLAQRRVFGGSLRNTALRMAALMAFYLPCLGIGLAIAAAIALYTM